MENKAKIKAELSAKLQQEKVFWSFDKNSCQSLSDWNLIKYALIHLDLADINLLFKIFSKKKIKRVWLDELVVQGDYLRNMNICIANLYFDIKHPVQYLKRMETYYLGKAATKPA
ncbi:MAG: hypothetical protein PHG27_12410 [Massilibacteroides sp.]|nr:hypothetical protein [Massilibacteroides sp.]MDD4116366.1 hypothetical protein [Massilibacteroides sp.]MDD4660675.1 hypothetical protein [Massilibacteroides sp.]